jgi:hypothetical protein
VVEASGIVRLHDSRESYSLHPVKGSLSTYEQINKKLGERVVSKPLETGPGCQIICYDPGDFIGPHTDHHPEQKYLRNGYVDIHIMLSEPTVLSQFIVYENNPGLLNEVENVGHGVRIAVYNLPFWHYATPLIARPGSRRARRWLFVASYVIDAQ